jgi:hypothetical protein
MKMSNKEAAESESKTDPSPKRKPGDGAIKLIVQHFASASLREKILTSIWCAAVALLTELSIAWIWEQVDKPKIIILLLASAFTAIIWVGAARLIAIISNTAELPTHDPASIPLSTTQPIRQTTEPSPATTQSSPSTQPATSPTTQAVSANRIFHVAARTTHSWSLDRTPLRFLYGLPPNQVVVSPIAVAMYLQIVDSGSSKYMIDSYAIDAMTKDGAWEQLKAVNLKVGSIYFSIDSKNAFRVDTTNSLDSFLSGRNIDGGETISGWMFFPNERELPTAKLRFRIKDTRGIESASLVTNATERETSDGAQDMGLSITSDQKDLSAFPLHLYNTPRKIAEPATANETPRTDPNGIK